MNKPALDKIIMGTLTVCFCMSLALSGKAQECRDRHSLALRWGVSVPLGNQFLSKAGYSGGDLEWDWHFSSCFSVGLGVGYRSSSEKGMTEDRYDGGSVSGYSDRSYSSLPLTVHARYLPFGRNGFKLQPYLNLSGGNAVCCFPDYRGPDQHFPDEGLGRIGVAGYRLPLCPLGKGTYRFRFALQLETGFQPVVFAGCRFGTGNRGDGRSGV